MLPGEELEQQLRDWGVWDAGMPLLAMQERYARFRGLDLGVAPRGEWARMRRELLEFEPFLACR